METGDSERIFAANRARSRIALSAEGRDGRTRLRRLHEAGSLRVRFPGPETDALEAVVLNTAGGIAGGDELDLELDVNNDARLVVTTAAAEKVYRSSGAESRMRVKLAAGPGSAIAWLPQETILFDQAQMVRTIDVDLAPDARLVIAEALVFGRVGMGEQVKAGRLTDQWRVRRNGRLLFAEALRLDGAIAQRLAQTAVAGGGIAIATVLAVPGDDAVAAAVREAQAQFRSEVGVSAWNGLAMVRFCAKDGAALRDDLVAVLALLHGVAVPRLWLN